MNVKTVLPFSTGPEYAWSAIDQPSPIPGIEASQSAVLFGMPLYGSEEEPVFATYNNTDLSVFELTGKFMTSGMEVICTYITAVREITCDEKWDEIVSKYCGKPMTLKDYYQMLYDFKGVDKDSH